ncbi:MAG: Rieske 2Fe-2S domain-containing protein [Planctomycetales bacterium]|nr:Rieske 2Fe-2S domain-containing protein [Planctomycetales bacterium]
MAEPRANHSSHGDANGAPRRGFMFQFLTGFIGFAVGLVPAAMGAMFALNPLMKKKNAAGEGGGGGESADGFVNLRVTAESLPENGTPQEFKVRADKVDAWNKFKDVEIGTVWLRRNKEGEIIAFSTICPHLGCAIDYRSSDGDFYCPCHTSTFNLDGEKQNSIPPRNMDQLEIRTDEQTGELWVKYEKFRAATHDKEPV